MNILIFIVLLIILFISLVELYNQYKYQKEIRDEPNEEIKRKLIAFRPVFHEKKLFILAIVNILLVLVVSYSLFSIFRLESVKISDTQRIKNLEELSERYHKKQNEDNISLKQQLEKVQKSLAEKK